MFIICLLSSAREKEQVVQHLEFFAEFGIVSAVCLG